MNSDCMIDAMRYAYEDIKMAQELWTKINPHISKGENSMSMNNIRWKVASTARDFEDSNMYELYRNIINSRYGANPYYRPEIKDVIFNDPATIVFWTDGTKTVVKCQECDIFDPEKGLTMAIAKKVYGNKGSYCNVIKKWCEPYHEKHDYSDAVTKAVYEKLATICDAFTNKYGHKESDG